MAVTHGRNVIFDFGIPFLPEFAPFASEADRNVSLQIMAMYVDFAASGDPTISGVPSGWEKYNASHRAYLQINTNPEMETSFYPLRMAFWNDYHPKLTQVKFDADKEVASGAGKVTIKTIIPFTLSLISVIISLATESF